MTTLDWAIVAGSIFALTWFSLRTVKYMQGVADFLSANRSAGRYLLTMAGSASGIGAISAVAYFEQYYDAGMPTIWWAWMSIPAGILITLTGWVTYRFRETRCLTLAQFFEVRYSRNFRIYAGVIVWLSGILNFGIFPYVASNFFVYFCGLPAEFTLMDSVIPTYWVIMGLTTGMALLYTVVGGHITVMITDCTQGIFVGIGLVVLCVFFLSQYSWSSMVESMNNAPAIAVVESWQKDARTEKLALDKAIEENNTEATAKHQEKYDELLANTRDKEKIQKEAEGRSMINPFDTGRVKSFGLAFFLIMVFNQFYGMMAWQGSQAYLSAATTPHEQKMGAIIFPWMYAVRLAGMVLLSICALTFLTHPDYLMQSAEARNAIDQLAQGDMPQLAIQQRVPIALSYMLPSGLRGFFCVVMVFLLITTQDTYMHSWGSIFVQDVVMPFRDKPLSPKAHVHLLRWSIVGVAIFAVIFAANHEPSEFIQMYFAITGAVVSGLGCAIIGGLYWKYGGTFAAYVAITQGAVLSVARIISMGYKDTIAAIVDKGPIMQFLHYTNNEINSQILWFYIMIICITSYIALSLLAMNKPFNLNKMLHRGKYDLKGDHKKAADSIKVAWLKYVGINEEFTRTDRFMALALVSWNGLWIAIFFGAMGYQFLIEPIPDSLWGTFWQVWLYMQVGVGVPALIWFTIGSVFDMKKVFQRLATLQRDDTDDGRVVRHHLPGEADEPGDE